MKTDNISKIDIDDLGKLRIFPETQNFYGVWRLAKEVHWDNEGLFLYSPKPREWSHFDWYKYIIDVIKNDGHCELILTDKTIWVNIPSILKEEIISH